MIEPGLFKHWKGNDYRVLFVAPWWSAAMPEETVYIGVYDEEIGLRSKRTVDTFMTALWSGNRLAENHERVIVYVALYGNGGVWARTEREFEETVEMGHGGVLRPRFARVGG